MSAFITAGAHAKLVQDRLGHASITRTLNVYGHIVPSTESAPAEDLDDLHLSAAGERAVASAV